MELRELPCIIPALDAKKSILISGPTDKTSLLKDIWCELVGRKLRVKLRCHDDSFIPDPENCDYFLLDHAPCTCIPFDTPTVIATDKAPTNPEEWDLVIMLDQHGATIIQKNSPGDFAITRETAGMWQPSNCP